MKFTLCIPILNATSTWADFTAALRQQTVQPDEVIVVDSESTDGSEKLAERSGFRVLRICRKDFRHGKTRQWMASMAPECEILLYMTQDAVLANPDAVAALLRRFSDLSVGAAYGRQLPHIGAGPIEAHARRFNYPEISQVRTMASAREQGFKAIFFSNSFGAYRRKALEAVGGFPEDVLFGEDTIVAARLLLAGWKVAYESTAKVYHSHHYTAREEFLRYIKVGELHASYPRIVQEFGAATGEGVRFVQSELRFLVRTAPYLIPTAMTHIAAKTLGYQLGYRRLISRT
jgi:rhamnosyltransferase